ncbi:DUF499 domain-containing protein [Leptolyngbya boryana CZ1]|uniref:DUF499 domain-containing protein n=1 Tax=Leptolyngbya boryana CZ1 TaxID=3060204 RepID=A0AA96WXY4_LEPBY|nr:DUF499 domain-containing protein [Leptolyngbya boryana]WNZ47372.1 DUF499 domain-containing protein [Leptolyngbya boryana CZ1]
MLPSIFDTCTLRDEIQAGELSLDLFAAKLRLVVEGKAPQVYQDPKIFFANTFPTDGLKTLVSEVFGRLMGAAVGSPIIRLETSFGGGKTHDEIALWHIAKNGRHIEGLDRFVDLTLIPDHPIQVAAIACQDLDPVNGVYHPESGITTYTLWGEIAYLIGGIEGYSLLKGSDEKRVSPGTVVLERLMKGQPTLIVLDEIARHLRAGKATTVGNSDLAAQVVAFLFSLMDLAAACNNLVFVYALASSSDSFGEETIEIREAIQASARQERVLSPSTDVEVYNIVKQRIFSSVSEKAAEVAAREYLGTYRASRLTLPDGCKDSHYAQVIQDSYPFHPELFSLLTKKIASIPNFQRTRGALRLFARVARFLWRDPSVWTPLIHPHHLPIGIDEEITSDMTSRLERPLMRLPIQADIYNPDGKEAHAQTQDQEWLAAGKPPFSSWVSRTIFLHSINQGIAAGIRRPELNLSLLTPGVESGFVDTALERLSSVAWYLDNDPITSISRFKEEPSINKIIAEEKEQVGRSEAKDDLRSRRDTIFADKVFKLVSAPEGSGDVDDVAEPVALCLIDFDEDTVRSSTDAPPGVVERIFNNTGESGKFRTFRNRLLFLVANRHELERAIDNAREYRAVKNILNSPNRLEDLSESQQKQLKDKSGSMDLSVRVSLTNAYRHLFYPSNDSVKAAKGLMHYPLPAQDAGDVKGKNNQQDVILKALKDCQKVRSEDAPPFAPAYVLQKVWAAGLDYWTTKALREAFAKDLGLNILLDAEVSKLRDTIRQGLQTGQWDLKVGDRVFIKTDEGLPALPDTIEFSDRMLLYRRGILEPPKPREVELSAQVMRSTETAKPIQVRWRAQGALTVSLYQDGNLVGQNFRPSDEYEGTVTQATVFRIVADYGNGETAQAETTAKVVIYNTGGNSGSSPIVSDSTTLFDVKPEQFDLEGTPNSVFSNLSDRVLDHRVRGIRALELSVSQVMDYRKLTTALPLLAKFPIQIDQTVTIQTGDQFVRLEYQGAMRGFQSFLTPTNALLGSSDVQANVMLKIMIEFPAPVESEGQEVRAIAQTLGRNPVDRINLTARVTY